MVMPELDGATWTMASRKLIPARYISAVILWLIIGAGILVLNLAVADWTTWFWIAFAVIVFWTLWTPARLVTAHGWAERQDDLVIQRGRMWRSTTVVPYGRMQYVEVEQGPILRMFSLSRVKLHTASPQTDAVISGVPSADAERLRDRLMSRGEARMAGL